MANSGFEVEFENYGGKRTASFDVTREGTIVVDVDGEYSFEIPADIARGLAELIFGAEQTPQDGPATGPSAAQTRRTRAAPNGRVPTR